MWPKHCFADNFWRQKRDGELLSWRATDTCHWNLLVKEGWNIYYTMRLTFLDHWGLNLSVSHLDSVARRKRKSFSTRYRSIERRDGETGVLLLVSTWDPVKVDGRFEPHFVCQWMFRNIQCSCCCRRGQKTQIVVPFPEGFRFSSCYRPASTVLGPLTRRLKLECHDFYELSRTFNWLQCWSIDAPMSHAFWIIALKYSDPGYLERSWKWFNDFGAEAFVKVWRYGWGAGL